MALAITTTQTQPQTIRAISLGGIVEQPRFPADVLELQPDAIATSDCEIKYELDAVAEFRFDLLKKPWPVVGQRVGYECEGTRFIGRVRSVTFRPVHHGMRWSTEVRGYVEFFDAKPLLGA